MHINHFSFYKVQKNEDANPYIESDNTKGLIAVADGLGGAGSFVHELSEKDYTSLFAERLKSVFLPEYYSEKNTLEDIGFEGWLNELIQPMVDEKPDTSALWGSRIAIARFVYYLKTHCEGNFQDEEKRSDLIRFIYKGMFDIVEEFQLKLCLIQGQLTLPTTLIGLKYELKEDDVLIDVLWAGDSRAYAILPGQGLKQLSADDEDGSGSINNLFAIKDSRPINTVLHYKSYLLPKKSVVFVCSDGFFDPYSPIDNIGVEAVFLDCLSKSTSFNELKNNWLEHYKPMTHDDCSISFVSFGFESFDELKGSFIERADYVINTLNDYFNYKKIIPIVNGEEDNPEQYIIERAEQRKADIARKIADEILFGQEPRDRIISSKLLNLYRDLQEERLKKNNEAKREWKEQICVQIRDYLQENCHELENVLNIKALRREKISKNVNVSELERLIYRTTNLTEKKIEREKTCAEIDEANKLLQSAIEEGTKLKEALTNRQSEIKKIVKFYDEQYKRDEASFKIAVSNYGAKHSITLQAKTIKEYYNSLRSDARKFYNVITEMKKFWDKKSVPSGYRFVSYPCDDHFITELKNVIGRYIKQKKSFDSASKKLDKLNAEFNKCQKKYYERLSCLCPESIGGLLDNPIEYFTEIAREKFIPPVKIEQESITIDILANELINYFNSDKQSFSDMILQFTYSNSPCIIDSIFNPSRLKLCRSYKTADIEKVKKLIDTISKLIYNYEDISMIVNK